jgi:hypothetical protein
MRTAYITGDDAGEGHALAHAMFELDAVPLGLDRVLVPKGLLDVEQRQCEVEDVCRGGDRTARGRAKTSEHTGRPPRSRARARSPSSKEVVVSTVDVNLSLSSSGECER